ncbi:MAG TPA: D-alanine--D-alanine ligase [Solirubrobacteraceae bacterium]|jgi:D-alanine-D-alanine ligase|nr:D-alanine--D-alanine ligase [Solirubrobacteraceae bacterium]
MSSGGAIVAMGGRSLEREISLRSGRRVERALRALGHSVQALDADGDFVARVIEQQPDFVFVAMHGRGGEDGTLQDLLETLGVPYTGSDPLASALCMDKMLFKRMLRLHGIPTPAFHSFNETAFRELGGARTFPRLLAELELPVVVKPVAQGSAIGIKFVHSAEQLPSAILGAFGYGDRVLVERRIVGRELAVTIVDRDGGPRALPIVELFTPESFYSYEAHYTIGQLRMESPADVEPAVRERVESVALASYRLMGCRDFARVDLILDELGEPQVLEINTIPGLTETGIVTAAAEAAGLTFEQLVAAIVTRAGAA